MIFIDACFRKETPYTPIWMMRQAGRYLDASLGFEAGYTLKKKALLGGYLDAGMGDSYFMSAGFMAGVRLFKGWVIPKIALGYQLQILGAKIDKYQFNIQSAVGSVGLF
ncbi:uroporphyrinogen decarboxylase family protein, partial [Helicobacter pylori]|uniref:uroporphyrinogen decarboxylase family protein n=1 Tax=Helicobacter pylori TaxID=210 RepID=UPI0039E14687